MQITLHVRSYKIYLRLYARSSKIYFHVGAPDSTRRTILVQERLKDFGQTDLITARPKTQIALAPWREPWSDVCKGLNANGLEKLMKERQMDTIVAPNSEISSILAIGHHPGIVVPSGYDDKGFPLAYASVGCRGTSRGWSRWPMLSSRLPKRGGHQCSSPS